MMRWRISFTTATSGCLGGTRGRAGRGVAEADRGGLKESVAEEEFHTGEGCPRERGGGGTSFCILYVIRFSEDLICHRGITYILLYILRGVVD